jgi:hypothetical protein
MFLYLSYCFILHMIIIMATKSSLLKNEGGLKVKGACLEMVLANLDT